MRTIDITKDFAAVTNLIGTGHNAEADAFVTKYWLGRNQQCYQPLGDLFLDFGAAAGVTDYRRWLDLAPARRVSVIGKTVSATRGKCS